MTTHEGRAADDAGRDARIVATVLGDLPNGLFRLRTTDGREMTAHAAMDLRKAFTRLLPGDRVAVEPSPFDPTRGRILHLVTSARQPHPSPESQPKQREQP